ncbi:XrtY-associated glycosyltransferase XYAG1 [Mucilaginibacter yixingensis]|uniref:XrtY-associated glycosyltransferase XYAG1 n=1 Tax=Mucilaginibacter yixingensis TaxID=1295612 RepID=UPI000D300CEE|nr:glycosyltransferase [Mucilaginibacter yixingensis]
MKILQINASYKPAFIYGGPTMSVAALSEALLKAGIDTEVYTTTANGKGKGDFAPGAQSVDGVKVHYFKRITGDHSHFSPALLRHLWQTVKQFDVVHIHAWWNLVSMFSALVALLRRVPVVVSPRGTLSCYTFQHRNSLVKSLFHQLIAQRLLKRTIIHTTAAMEQQNLQTVAAPRGYVIIPNFVALPAEIPNKKTSEDRPLRLLYFSRIDPKKNPDLIIKALPHVSLPCMLTFAGNGDDSYIESLKTLSNTLGVADRINWIGFRKDDKFEVMADHDIMVLPSQDENFANVVIESLSVGTAVIVSKTVGLADYVANKQLGLICDTDELSLAQQINLLANNPEKLNDIATNAPQTIRADFDDKRLTSQYIDLYHKTIGLSNNG